MTIIRDPERIPKYLEKIKKSWKKFPDFRLGQLIINSLLCCEGDKERVLFYIEDSDLITLIEHFAKHSIPIDKDFINRDKKV